MAKWSKKEAAQAKNDIAILISDWREHAHISTPMATRVLSALQVIEEYLGEKSEPTAITMFNHGLPERERIT